MILYMKAAGDTINCPYSISSLLRPSILNGSEKAIDFLVMYLFLFSIGPLLMVKPTQIYNINIYDIIWNHFAIKHRLTWIELFKMCVFFHILRYILIFNW